MPVARLRRITRGLKCPRERNPLKLKSCLIQGLPGGSDSKEATCNAGDLGSILGKRRSPGEGNGYPIQYSCFENSMGRGAWRATVHGVTKSQTQLSDWHLTGESANTPHSKKVMCKKKGSALNPGLERKGDSSCYCHEPVVVTRMVANYCSNLAIYLVITWLEDMTQHLLSH